MNFCKYHGAGNDFILIDNRYDKIELSQSMIYNLCHRRFGIGAGPCFEGRFCDLPIIKDSKKQININVLFMNELLIE